MTNPSARVKGHLRHLATGMGGISNLSLGFGMCGMMSMGTFTYKSKDMHMYNKLVGVVSSSRMFTIVNRRVKRIIRSSSGSTVGGTCLASTTGGTTKTMDKAMSGLASSRLKSVTRTLTNTRCSRGRRCRTSRFNFRFYVSGKQSPCKVSGSLGGLLRLDRSRTGSSGFVRVFSDRPRARGHTSQMGRGTSRCIGDGRWLLAIL